MTSTELREKLAALVRMCRHRAGPYTQDELEEAICGHIISLFSSQGDRLVTIKHLCCGVLTKQEWDGASVISVECPDCPQRDRREKERRVKPSDTPFGNERQRERRVDWYWMAKKLASLVDELPFPDLPHQGSCNPESGCDNTCAEAYYISSRNVAKRTAIAEFSQMEAERGK